MWRNVLNFVLGLLVIGTAFVALTPTALMWTLSLTGAAVAVLSLWNMAWEEPTRAKLTN